MELEWAVTAIKVRTFLTLRVIPIPRKVSVVPTALTALMELVSPIPRLAMAVMDMAKALLATGLAIKVLTILTLTPTPLQVSVATTALPAVPVLALVLALVSPVPRA